MTKNYTLSALLFIMVSSAFAQPTITADSIHFYGRMVYAHTFDSINPNPVPAGSNVVWDFSNLKYKGYDSVVFTNKPFSSYASNFPEANEVMEEYTAFLGNKRVEKFNLKNSEYYSALGAVYLSNQIVSKLAHHKMMLKFPFVFNTTFYDSFFGHVSYDGYGTLKLPSGTYTNVYRTVLVDSSITSGYIYTYNWFQGSRRLLTIYINKTTHINTFFTHGRSTLVTASNNKIKHTEVTISPNPNNGIFTIDGIAEGSEIKVINALGQVVQTLKNANSSSTIYITKAGLYTVYITNKQEVRRHKVLVL